MSPAVVAVQLPALGTAPMDIVPVAVCESAPAPAVVLQMVPGALSIVASATVETSSATVLCMRPAALSLRAALTKPTSLGPLSLCVTVDQPRCSASNV